MKQRITITRGNFIAFYSKKVPSYTKDTPITIKNKYFTIEGLVLKENITPKYIELHISGEYTGIPDILYRELRIKTGYIRLEHPSEDTGIKIDNKEKTLKEILPKITKLLSAYNEKIEEVKGLRKRAYANFKWGLQDILLF